MRRGSVTTHADDARRLSTGMVTHELRSNSVGAASTTSHRHEFHMNDVIYERPGGCFITYRMIAFAFVFVLAVLIAAAFLAVWFSEEPEKTTTDPLTKLATEEYQEDKYALSKGIAPKLYRLELEPIETLNAGKVRFKGHVVIEFSNSIAPEDVDNEQSKRLVLNSKHLEIHTVKLVSVDVPPPEEDEEHGARRNRREVQNEPSSSLATTNASSDEHSHIDSRFRSRVVEEPSPEDVLRITGNSTDETTGVFMLELANTLPNGSYSLQIEYEATVDHRALFATNFTQNQRLLLVSKLKPANAPRLFPTLDEIHLKADFILRIRHSSDTKALSNSPTANSSRPSENTTLDEFAKTPKISPHNLAFVVGNVELLGEVAVNNNDNVVIWGAAERMGHEFYLHQKIASVVHAWENLFVGVPKPIGKLDIVALPVDYEGTSAPGLIVVRDSLFFTPSNAAAATKADALLNLIGLIGQQWLGASVDARNWTDAWYVEGSELFLQHVLLEKIDKELEVSDSFLVNVQLESMENNGYNLSKALDSSVDRHRIEAFDLPDIYGKGACLISMLHNAVKRSAFKQGYADFLRRWMFSSTDSDVFLKALTLHKQIDDTKMVDAFRGWTRLPGYPIISVAWNRENGSVTVKQARFTFDLRENLAVFPMEEEEMEKKELWWVPLTYATDEEQWLEPKTVWLKGKEEATLDNVKLADANGWILFNVNKTGYYRVNYDAATWRSLTEALRSNHATFPPATRASLIDDALSLARQGSIEYETALELLHYLGPNERDYAPWKALEKHVLQLDFALYETPAYPAFQEYMQQLISKFYDENEPKIDHGSPVTMLAMHLACSFEYTKCTSWAKSKWEEIFTNNKENSLPNHVRETVYCEGAQRGGQEELTYLMSKFESTQDRDEKDRLLSSLGCFQTPWILQKVLNEILEEKYDESDVRAILRAYAKNPAAALAARRFIHENWPTMVERFKDSYWTLRAFVGASSRLLFTAHDMEEFKAFTNKYYDQMVSMGYHHWVALNEVKAASWSKRLKDVTDDIQAWFTNHTITTV